MSRRDNEPVERKPLPSPCETCGAATDHDRRLSVYCEDKLPPSQVYVKFGDVDLGAFDEKDVRVSMTGSGASGMFDAFDPIYLAASRAAFRRERSAR